MDNRPAFRAVEPTAASGREHERSSSYASPAYCWYATTKAYYCFLVFTEILHDYCITSECLKSLVQADSIYFLTKELQDLKVASFTFKDQPALAYCHKLVVCK